MRFFLLALSFLLVSPTLAGEVEKCGIPVPSEMNTDVPANYCDIYQRQIDYYYEDKKFKAELNERRENYNAPRSEAIRRYEESIQALNAKRSSE